MRPALAFAGLMFAACGSDPTYGELQAQVFNVSCNQSSCHSVNGRRGELVLVDGMSHAQLVNVAADNEAAAAEGLLRVVPGDPERSFLYRKLRSPLELRYGEVMPLGTGGLDEERLDGIRAWIARGAPED